MKCCICGKEIIGDGNNPDPIKNKDGEFFGLDEKCCDECDNKYVLPVKLANVSCDYEKARCIQRQVDALNQPVKKRLIAVIERPDGTTYEQEIADYGDTNASIKEAQKLLGEPYGWKTVDGRKERYLKSDAYLIVNAYYRS